MLKEERKRTEVEERKQSRSLFTAQEGALQKGKRYDPDAAGRE